MSLGETHPTEVAVVALVGRTHTPLGWCCSAAAPCFSSCAVSLLRLLALCATVELFEALMLLRGTVFPKCALQHTDKHL
jgi:hypothetical protein